MARRRRRAGLDMLGICNAPSTADVDSEHKVSYGAPNIQGRITDMEISANNTVETNCRSIELPAQLEPFAGEGGNDCTAGHAAGRVAVSPNSPFSRRAKPEKARVTFRAPFAAVLLASRPQGLMRYSIQGNALIGCAVLSN